MPISILIGLSLVCLFAVIARLWKRQLKKDKRMADSFSAAIRSNRI